MRDHEDEIKEAGMTDRIPITRRLDRGLSG